MTGLYFRVDMLVIVVMYVIFFMSNKYLLLSEINFLFWAEVEDNLIRTSRVHLFVDRKSICLGYRQERLN